MSPYTPEEIEQRFARLPEPLKDEMMSVENSERIFEVGKKFALTIEQIGFLAEESGYVVLGLTHPNDFVARLKDHLRVDEEKAKTIAREINHQVFFPLREMLKSTHQFELTQEQIQTSPPPIPSMPRVQPMVPKIPPAPPVATPPVPPIKNPISPPSPSASLPKPSITPIPPLPSLSSSTPIQPAIPPAPLPKPPVVPPLPSPSTPIPPPLPSRPLESARLPSANPPLPPIIRPTPPPLIHPNLPHVEEKKPLSAIPFIQTKPAIPPASRSIEGIKPKESSLPSVPISPLPKPPVPPEQKPNPVPSPQDANKIAQAPLPPSQMMQKKFLDDTKHVKAPIQPEVERIKESLFAPPSASAQPKPAVQAVPSPIQPPVPIPQPPPKPPSSYTTHDPYREPIE